MKDLINLLLIKDEEKRPRIIDIIKQPYVKAHMHRFVTQASGQGGTQLNQKVPKKDQVTQALKIKELKQQDINTLSNQDKQKLLKEMKYQQEFEMMK